MALTCIIVDDEPLAVKMLESFVAKTPELECIGSYSDSIEAINVVKEKKPQLLFLDIQMPDLNGIELAHMLPKDTKVIFTTAFKEYAFESYEVNALDYLLKPIRYNKFVSAMDKAKQWFGINSYNSQVADHELALSQHIPTNETTTIFLRVSGEFRQVSINKILYISGMKDYVMFVLEDERRPLVTYLRMKAVEEMLPHELFMRVSRSYIVALNKIQRFDSNDCIYINDEKIHVTDAYLKTFQLYLRSHQITMENK